MNVVAEKQRVAVIGGGLAGLSAALNLANQGLQVVLFERSSQVGGRAQTTVKDGYYINFGPHAHYVGGAGRAFLKQLGIEPVGNPPPAGNPTAFYKGNSERLPLTPQAIFATKLFGILDKIRLLRFFSRLSSIEQSSVWSLTVNQWIDSDKDLSHGSSALKGFVRTLVQLTTYTGDMDKLNASAGLTQLKLAIKSGVVYLHGGWAQMVDALLEKAAAAGVHIHSGCEVTEVVKTAGRTQSPEAAGSVVSVGFHFKDRGTVHEAFDGVILAVPPDVVSMITHPAAISDGKETLRISDEPLVDVKAACLDVCLKELTCSENTFALGIDEPLYYSVHSQAAQLAPPSGALIHVAYYLKEGQSGTAEIEKRLEQVMDTMQPGWREKLVFKRFLANIVVTHKLLSVQNAKLGGYWSEETSEPRVFRAGDWVGVHQLADGSLGSAQRSSELLATYLKTEALKKEPAMGR